MSTEKIDPQFENFILNDLELKALFGKIPNSQIVSEIIDNKLILDFQTKKMFAR